jgi:hypothetical protein
MIWVGRLISLPVITYFRSIRVRGKKEESLREEWIFEVAGNLARAGIH